MPSRRTTALTFGLALAWFGGLAAAKEAPRLVHPWGMSVQVGGGVADFTADESREMTGVGGIWDARLLFGTREHVGFEAAYLGTAQAIDALGLDQDALLVGNGVEGLVRLNLLTGALQPYVFGGAGWKRYDLANVQTNTSSVKAEDDILEIPLGIGVAYRLGRVIVDARGTYRAAQNEDLVPAPQAGTQNLDSYNLSAHIGFEF